MKGSMIKETLKKFFSHNIIQVQINFLFISFIFLSGLKYDFFQFRFFILILLIPCGLYLIKDYINKNFIYYITGSSKKISDSELCLLVGFFLVLWPLTTNGNFFNNWINLMSFYPLGFYLYVNRRKDVE